MAAQNVTKLPNLEDKAEHVVRDFLSSVFKKLFDTAVTVAVGGILGGLKFLVGSAVVLMGAQAASEGSLPNPLNIPDDLVSAVTHIAQSLDVLVAAAEKYLASS